MEHAGTRHPKKQSGKAGAVGGHPELQAVYARMQPVWKHIRVYGVSIGAWFAMQALQTQTPEKALLVSPVVEMEKLILALMQQAGVTEEQLRAAGEIPTDFGETLSWIFSERACYGQSKEDFPQDGYQGHYQEINGKGPRIPSYIFFRV